MSDLHVMFFSERIWEATKRTNKESTIYRGKKNPVCSEENLRSWRANQGLERNQGEKGFLHLHLCNIKLLRTVFIHSFWSTLILEMANVYHLISLISWHRCSLLVIHFTLYSQVLTKSRNHKHKTPRIYSQPKKWSLKSLIASLMS